jgi:hypothetical protein
LDKLKKSIRKRPDFDLNKHNKRYRNGDQNGTDKTQGSDQKSKSGTASSAGSSNYEEKGDVHHKEDVQHENDRDTTDRQETVDSHRRRKASSGNGRYEETWHRESVQHEENHQKDNKGPVRFSNEDNVKITIQSDTKPGEHPVKNYLSKKMKNLTHRRPTLSSRTSSFDAKSFLDYGTTNFKKLFSDKAKSMASILPGTQNSRQEAKWLARQLFNNIVAPEQNILLKDDFVDYFPTRDEAEKAFNLFDRDKNGNISKRELRNGTIEIFKERKHLAASLRDLSQASGKLDNILISAFAVIWGLIVAAAFGVDVGSQLLPLWTMFVAISFIFGNSAKEMFDSIIFVFVTVSQGR